MGQSIQWCFGKYELAVKISFCFPRCSTHCQQQNLALGISALTCQIQLHPPLYSRSSWTAYIKGKNWLLSPSGSLREGFDSGCFQPRGAIWKKIHWHWFLDVIFASYGLWQTEPNPEFSYSLNLLHKLMCYWMNYFPNPDVWRYD